MSEEIMRLPAGLALIRSARQTLGGSRLRYGLGIARETCGAQQLAMSLVVVPPGGAARAHYHLAHETIIHVVRGRAETRYGSQLRQSIVNTAGDFIFIGARVPHAPRNLSDSEPSIAINARNDAAQQEPIVPVEPDQPLDTTWDADALRSLTPPPLALHPGELFRAVGANGRTIGAEGLCLLRFAIAPRAALPAQAHPHSEAGLYVLDGACELRCGTQLEHTIAAETGDLIFVPPALKYTIRNLESSACQFVMARTDADRAQDTICCET